MAAPSWAHPFLSYGSRPPHWVPAAWERMVRVSNSWRKETEKDLLWREKSRKKCFSLKQYSVFYLHRSLAVYVLFQRWEDWGLENLRDLPNAQYLQVMSGLFSYEAHILYILQLWVIGMKSAYFTWLTWCYLSSPTPTSNFHLKFLKYSRLPLPSGPLLLVLPLSGMFFLLSIWMSLIS